MAAVVQVEVVQVEVVQAADLAVDKVSSGLVELRDPEMRATSWAIRSVARLY